MSWAIVLGAVGVGGIAGGGILGSQDEGVERHELGAAGFLPGADPTLANLTNLTNLQAGFFDPLASQQAGPVQQVLNSALQSGQMDRRDFRLLSQALSQPGVLQGLSDLEAVDPETGEPRRVTRKDKEAFLAEQGITDPKQAKKIIRGLPQVMQALPALGFENFDALAQAQQQHTDQLAQIQAQFAPVAQQVQRGLLASQGRIGETLQNLPNLLTGEANPFTERFREDALIQAQRTGQNPFQLLEQADALALNRALQLVSGEQAVFGQQIAPSGATAQLRQGGGLGAAQLGGAQAAILANALGQNAAMAQQNNQFLGSSVQSAGLLGGFGFGGGGSGSGGPATGQRFDSFGRPVGFGSGGGDFG